MLNRKKLNKTGCESVIHRTQCLHLKTQNKAFLKTNFLSNLRNLVVQKQTDPGDQESYDKQNSALIKLDPKIVTK